MRGNTKYPLIFFWKGRAKDLPVQYIREGDKHLQDTHEDEQEKRGGGGESRRAKHDW
jgi:hypothetical protein